jgi:hypothetical protein
MILLLAIGLAFLIAGGVFLLCNLPGLAIVAFIIGLVLVLVSLFRRRRMTAGDAAIVASINSTSGQ